MKNKTLKINKNDLVIQKGRGIECRFKFRQTTRLTEECKILERYSEKVKDLYAPSL